MTEPNNPTETTNDDQRGYDLAAKKLAFLGLSEEATMAYALTLGARNCDPHTTKTCCDLLAQVVGQPVTDRLYVFGLLAEYGLPVRRLALERFNRDACNPETLVYSTDFAELHNLPGENVLEEAGLRLAELMGASQFAEGEKVRVAEGQPEAGATGVVRQVRASAQGFVYSVAIDGVQGAPRQLTADQLISLETPATGDLGGYWTPLFQAPDGQHVVCLPYPDMVAPDEAGAQGCLLRWRNSLSGIFAEFSGLKPLERFALVEPSTTYLTATLNLGDGEKAQRLNVVVLEGPRYEAWRANADVPAPPLELGTTAQACADLNGETKGAADNDE